MWAYNLVIRDKRGPFAVFINCVMFAHIIVFCSEFYMQGALAPWLIYVQEALNVVFVLIYSFEIVLRLIALGPWRFMRVKWYLYDVVVVTGALGCSVANILLVIVGANSYALTQAAKITVLLVILRLVQRLDRLEMMFKTVIESFQNVANVLIIFVLAIIIFAIMGVQVFGLTRYEGYTAERVSFRNFLYGSLLLFRTVTGEEWHRVMHDLTVETPYCVENLADYANRDCGSPSYGIGLFLSFYIIGTYICLNMFIVVIVDNFSYFQQSKDQRNMLKITRNDTRIFKTAWLKADPSGSGFIPEAEIPRFLSRLGGVFEVRVNRRQQTIREDLVSPEQQAFDALCDAYYFDTPEKKARRGFFKRRLARRAQIEDVNDDVRGGKNGVLE